MIDEFLLAHPVFCMPLESASAATVFPAAARRAPEGWVRVERGVWVAYQPAGQGLPQQGWKVHLSTTAPHAEAALETLWDWCVSAGISFKTLRGPQLHAVLNGKGAARSSSGKLAAIYPVDEAELTAVLTDLGERLRGIPGPYVLTDLRWGDGPLYVRYGGFLDAWAPDPETGEPALSLVAPDGTTRPDRRRPVFETPEWVDVPAIVQRQIDAAADLVPGSLGYTVTGSLHASNGGGVYLGRDETGRQVVLKEARPHAGLDGHGIDAVSRLAHEARVLRDLADTGVLPRLVDEVQWWEHRFLVEEHIAGETLHDRVARTHPYIYPDPSPQQVRDYAAWALEVTERVAQAVHALHERGWVFGDLHPNNVMLADDGRVLLLDPELAFPVDAHDQRVLLGDPGFRHPAILGGGPALDDYALACLRLAVLLPMTSLIHWDRDLIAGGAAERLLATAERLFPLPPQWGAQLLDELRRLTGAPTPRPADPNRARTLRALAATELWPERLAETILRDATPQRLDRLYPAGPAGLTGCAGSVAHGAAGVLHALGRICPDAIPDAHLDWVLAAADRDRQPATGLLDGLLGTAVVLADLGDFDRADHVASIAARRLGITGTAHLAGGAAGQVLAGLDLHRATGSSRHRELADQAAARLAALVAAAGDDPADAPAVGDLARPTRAGLTHGWSGVALALLRHHQAGGPAAHRTLAVEALRRDIAQLVPAGGTLHLPDGTGRILLYLASGSLGVGLVAQELLAAHPPGHPGLADLAEALTSIRRATRTQFSVFPGLFEGRAGILASAVLLGADEETVGRHVQDLAWHLVEHDGALTVPGVALIRVTHDLASGTAGVLLALQLASAGSTALLPGLRLAPLGAPVPVATTAERR